MTGIFKKRLTTFHRDGGRKRFCKCREIINGELIKQGVLGNQAKQLRQVQRATVPGEFPIHWRTLSET